jgi:hypothetical protein
VTRDQDAGAVRALRLNLVRRMRAEHVRRALYNPLMWKDSQLEKESGGGFPVTGPWSFRETCEHHGEWTEVGEHWLQCRKCHWCKPKLGKPPKLEKLPAILKGRVLPPLSGKVDLHAVYANAGFVLDDDRRSVISVVRVRVAQHTWTTDPGIRRCGVEVRFRGHGWREAAVFMETWLHRLVAVLREAEPRRPKALWRAIQSAMEQRWPLPWERESWKERA